ncbi:hypothetical protein GCM10020000_77540 [Streptomyces olivoverticillatus]
MIGAAAAAGAQRTGWWIVTGCGLAVLVIGTITSGPWAARTARRSAARLESEQSRTPVTTR